MPDNFGKSFKDKMDKVFAKGADKEPKYMAWFEIRPGYHRCIGVENKNDVTEEFTQDELQWIHFTIYKNPKIKGDQKL